jgi:hypothetical protein
VSIFGHITPDIGDRVIREAAAAILDRAGELALRERPWSLAELRLDEDDYSWLCDWVRLLRDPYTKLRLDSWHSAGLPDHDLKMNAALGLVLFALIAETGRRHAQSKRLWSHIIDAHFPDGPPSSLFVQGQPSQLLKDALERAAREAGLRHLFGIEGLQNWYDSVQLQYGFSVPSASARLAYWLVGQMPPLSADYLLGNGPLHSASFELLWASLRRLRKKRLTRAQCLQLLLTSCWALPDSVDALLDAALVEVSFQGGEGGDDEETRLPFLTTPRLDWTPPLSPSFVCEVANLGYFGLESPTYSLLVAGEVKLRLLRQPDGTYRSEPEGPVRLPPTHAAWRVELVDDLGDVDAVMELRLWDSEDDVNVFSMPRGAPIENAHRASLKPTVAYALLLADDLEVRPEPAQWCHLPEAESKLWYLPAGWEPSEVRATLGDAELWRPGVAGVERVAPDWVKSIQVIRRSLRMRIGEPADFDLSHAEDIEIGLVRVNRRTVEFERVNDWTTRLAPITVDADPSAHRLRFTVEAWRGSEERVVTCDVQMLVHGAARLEDAGWVPLTSTQVITVDDALNLPSRVYPPLTDDGDNVTDWVLLEGDVFIRRLWTRPRPIDQLGGLGAGLVAQKGRFNVLDDPMPVVAAVHDPGLVHSVTRSSINPRFALVVRGHVEPDDEEYKVVWWDGEGAVQVLTPESWRVLPEGVKTIWTVPSPNDAGEPVAIGVAYGGQRAGAWWSDDWLRRLPGLFNVDPRKAAAIVRWLRLPIVDRSAAAAMSELFAEHPRPLCESWIRGLNLPAPLVHRAADQQWYSAVRSILSGANLGKNGYMSVFAGLLVEREHKNHELLEVVAHELMRLNPLLAYPVLCTGVQAALIPKWGAPQTRFAFDEIIGRLAGSERESPGQDICLDLVGMVQTLSEELELDSAFVKQALIQPSHRLAVGGNVTSLERDNVMTAIGSLEPFRRVLTILMLLQVRHDCLPATCK